MFPAEKILVISSAFCMVRDTSQQTTTEPFEFDVSISAEMHKLELEQTYD